MAEKQKSRFQMDYSISKTVGSGSFGVVFSAKHNLDKKDYAVKVTFLTNPNVLREVELLARLSHHRNIVQYHTCWKDVMKVKNVKDLMGKEFSKFSFPKGMKSIELLCIRMELCSENLREWLKRQEKISEDVHSAMALQLAMGIEHLHCHKIIHRDLKPENIFLSFDNTLKIGDLGLAAAIEESKGSRCFSLTKGTGTELYKAPEQDTKNYGKEVDLFSFGLILFELAAPEIQPGRNDGVFDRFEKTLNKLKFRGLLPADFKERWPRLAGLVERMVDYEVGTRANIFDVFKYLSGKSDAVDLAKKDLSAKREQNRMVVPPAKEHERVENRDESVHPTVPTQPTITPGKAAKPTAPPPAPPPPVLSWTPDRPTEFHKKAEDEYAAAQRKGQATAIIVTSTAALPNRPAPVDKQEQIPATAARPPAPAIPPPPPPLPLTPISAWPAELLKAEDKHAEALGRATQRPATPATVANPTAALPNKPVANYEPALGIPKEVDKQEQKPEREDQPATRPGNFMPAANRRSLPPDLCQLLPPPAGGTSKNPLQLSVLTPTPFREPIKVNSTGGFRKALLEVESGGSIILSGGTFVGPFNLEKDDVAIIGNRPASVILISEKRSKAFSVTGKRCKIKGLHFSVIDDTCGLTIKGDQNLVEDVGFSSPEKGFASFITGNKNEVRNCCLDGSLGGIFVRGDENLVDSCYSRTDTATVDSYKISCFSIAGDSNQLNTCVCTAPKSSIVIRGTRNVVREMRNEFGYIFIKGNKDDGKDSRIFDGIFKYVFVGGNCNKIVGAVVTEKIVVTGTKQTVSGCRTPLLLLDRSTHETMTLGSNDVKKVLLLNEDNELFDYTKI